MLYQSIKGNYNCNIYSYTYSNQLIFVLRTYDIYIITSIKQ